MTMINDQLDFSKPELVTIIIDGNKLKIYINDSGCSMQLTYQLKDNSVVMLPSPRPPLQQS
jgi:hypothetical protein